MSRYSPAWVPASGSWVARKYGSMPDVRRVTEQGFNYAGMPVVLLDGRTWEWPDELRPATLEEIARAQLASLEGL